MPDYKLQTVRDFKGFGSGDAFGEYFHSQGMARTLNGISPRWKTSNTANSDSLSGLALINWFTQETFGNMYVFGIANDGKIYRSQYGYGTWELAHTPSESNQGNGLIADQKGQLLYMGNRYLGKYDGSTWDDTFQDFGASNTTTDFRPVDRYEDWVLIGNKNKVAGYNTSDDSFSENLFDLPEKFTIRAISAGRTGVLLGANISQRSVLVLWDAFSDRSIAPWITINDTVKTIIPYRGNWLVICSRMIYITNGYSLEEFVKAPDPKITRDFMNVIPQGVEILSNKLILANTSGTVGKIKSGIWILDLDAKLWEFTPVSSGITSNIQMGAIFFDTQARIHSSYGEDSIYKIDHISNSLPNSAHLITAPVGGVNANWKLAEAIKLNLGLSPYSVGKGTITFDVEVKIADMRRQIWNYGETNGTASGADKIKVNGANTLYTRVEEGDEVIILKGDNAGKSAHIKSIANAGQTEEEWTLDRALSNVTGNQIMFNLMPFKLVRKLSLNDEERLDYLFFNCKDKQKGKRFLIKILFTNLSGHAMPEVQGVDFIYQDLGIF